MASTKKKGSGGGSGGGGGIFDRLTDSSQYTGAHKQRFDGEGHGRGKAGRVDEARDTGFVQGARVSSATPTKAPAVTAPSLGSPPAAATTKAPSPKAPRAAAASTTAAPAKKPASRGGGGGGIFDRLTDSSQYTGAHKQRFDGDGHGRGKSGRVDSVHDTGYVQGARLGHQ